MGADFWDGWAGYSVSRGPEGPLSPLGGFLGQRGGHRARVSVAPRAGVGRGPPSSVLVEEPLGSSPGGSPAWAVVRGQDTPRWPQQCRNEVPLLALAWSPRLGLQRGMGGSVRPLGLGWEVGLNVQLSIPAPESRLPAPQRGPLGGRKAGGCWMEEAGLVEAGPGPQGQSAGKMQGSRTDVAPSSGLSLHQGEGGSVEDRGAVGPTHFQTQGPPGCSGSQQGPPCPSVPP